MKRVDHVIVGYDISRTGSLTLGSNAASSNLAEGEVVVLDKYGKLLTAGKTISDSDTIFLGIGTKTTYTEKGSGSAYTRRPIKLSGPIVGSGVKSYRKYAYTAPTQRVATAASTGLTPSTTEGAYDYVVRIVYTDNFVASQTPSQFIQEYRVTSNATDGASLQALYDAFRTKIAADSNARVAGSGTTTLILTGLTNTDAALNDIDPYMFVDFKVIFYKVQLTGSGAGTQSAAGPAVTYNTAFQGEGTWKQVRDIEKAAKAYTGIVNWIDFPVPSNTTDWYTVLNKTYDQIVIEHDVPYQSSDMDYTKTAKQTTVLAFPIVCGQMSDVLAILNPWMASCPGAFDNI